ncbi:MAG: dockerin type I repeat-containing protein [Oscillospiraceae bacterium]|nr:dockerin type I repeat-containing protein [Oscillospiraceae bacterium]
MGKSLTSGIAICLSLMFSCVTVCAEPSENEIRSITVSEKEENTITVSEGESVQLIWESGFDISDIRYTGYLSHHKTAISHDLKLIGHSAGEDYISLYTEARCEPYDKYLHIKVKVLPDNNIPADNRREIDRLNEFKDDDYVRRKIELTGALPEKYKRLNLDKVHEIIDSTDDFKIMCSRFNEYHGFPDVIPENFGHTSNIYWLDEKGTESIEINISEEFITYYVTDENGYDYAYQTLYPEDYATELNEFTVKPINYQYIQYNEISIPSDVTCGDIDLDGKIDITDISVLSLALIGDSTLSVTEYKAADVTHDRQVNVTDLAALRQYVSKVINSFDIYA